MDERALRAEVRGWGPVDGELDVYCPVKDCSWERTWDDVVSIGELVRTVAEHLADVHQ